ncbi:MAG: hypothetical protein AAGL69_10695 [Pseudomonadota bacterium]
MQSRLSLLVLFALATTSVDGRADPPELIEQWVIGGFDAPEGVAYGNNRIYISNVNGPGSDKDGNGYVSVLSTNGEVIERRLVTGLDAPKGMVLVDDRLYIADIDRVHIANALSGEVETSLSVEGARFLNDVVLWNDTVYVSDSATSTIFAVTDEGVSPWKTGDFLDGVNGLTAFGDRLLVSTMSSGSLYTLDDDDGLNEIANGMVNADGIGVADEHGGYLVSSWPGQIWFVDESGETTELLNTEDEGVYQNDLTYVEDMLIVPNWNPGTVTMWRLR